MHHNITQDFVQAKYTNGSAKEIKHSNWEQVHKRPAWSRSVPNPMIT